MAKVPLPAGLQQSWCLNLNPGELCPHRILLELLPWQERKLRRVIYQDNVSTFPLRREAGQSGNKMSEGHRRPIWGRVLWPVWQNHSAPYCVRSRSPARTSCFPSIPSSLMACSWYRWPKVQSYTLESLHWGRKKCSSKSCTSTAQKKPWPWE